MQCPKCGTKLKNYFSLNGIGQCPFCDAKFDDRPMANTRIKELVEADDEGRVVILPCVPGDKIYWCERKSINEYIVKDICVRIEAHSTDGHSIASLGSESFGKTVFTTREEAEQALQASKEGVNHE